MKRRPKQHQTSLPHRPARTPLNHADQGLAGWDKPDGVAARSGATEFHAPRASGSFAQRYAKRQGPTRKHAKTRRLCGFSFPHFSLRFQDAFWYGMLTEIPDRHLCGTLAAVPLITGHVHRPLRSTIGAWSTTSHARLRAAAHRQRCRAPVSAASSLRSLTEHIAAGRRHQRWIIRPAQSGGRIPGRARHAVEPVVPMAPPAAFNARGGS